MTEVPEHVSCDWQGGGFNMASCNREATRSFVHSHDGKSGLTHYDSCEEHADEFGGWAFEVLWNHND